MARRVRGHLPLMERISAFLAAPVAGNHDWDKKTPQDARFYRNLAIGYAAFGIAMALFIAALRVMTGG